jgi:hypothetical protein
LPLGAYAGEPSSHVNVGRICAVRTPLLLRAVARISGAPAGQRGRLLTDRLSRKAWDGHDRSTEAQVLGPPESACR